MEDSSMQQDIPCALLRFCRRASDCEASEQGGRPNPYGILALSHLETVSIRSHWPEPLSPHMKFAQGRTSFCYYITLR